MHMQDTGNPCRFGHLQAHTFPPYIGIIRTLQ